MGLPAVCLNCNGTSKNGRDTKHPSHTYFEYPFKVVRILNTLLKQCLDLRMNSDVGSPEKRRE